MVDQGPTARILALLTFRPDFTPPWTGRSHFTQLTLTRLSRRAGRRDDRPAGPRQGAPAEVCAQIVAKTDGVPLFVEELTKMVLESGLLQEREERYELTGPLPPWRFRPRYTTRSWRGWIGWPPPRRWRNSGPRWGGRLPMTLLQAVSPWTKRPAAAACGSWWRPSSSTSGGCHRRPPTVQACPHPGGRLSVLAQEHAAAVPSAHCPGVGGAVS